MIEIKEVKTAKQRKLFVDFPTKLYKGVKQYVHPLRSSELELFNPKKNVSFEDCEAIYFLAYKDGELVGRIAGIIQRLYNNKVNEKRVRFTRFDAINDKEVAKALFDSVENWARLKGMNIVHGPMGFNDLDREGMLIEGFDEAQEKGLPDCRILVSLRREQELDSASKIVDWVLSNRHPRVVGLSIDGNEELSAVSNQKFAPPFAKCKAAGLGITVHAGESSGPEGVVEALDLLGADRIDHGVRSVESPELMRRLHDERIPLDVCFSSNILCDLYTPEAHPIKKLYDSGILVNASTDDPHLFQISLTDELERIALQFGFSIKDLLAMQYNALEAVFCDEGEKQAIRRKLDEFRNTIA